MGDDLEQAVRRLLDKDEIVDLVHRYSYYVDNKLHDEVASLFTEDCVVDYGPGFGPPTRGRKAFRGLFGIGRGFVNTSHHNANVLIGFEGEDRGPRPRLVLRLARDRRGRDTRIWGAYYDVVVRTAEGWRFAERQLRVAGSEGWDSDFQWHPLLDAPRIDV